MKKEITAYRLYRWRYFIAFLVVLGISVSLALMTFWYAPAGLRQAEIDQIAGLNFKHLFTGENIINFPYKLAQLTSLKFLGLSTLSIKLPSIIFGALSILGFYWLIRRWINRKTSLIATGLVLSTSQFIFLLQDGTPLLMFVFWQILIMMILTQIKQLLPDGQQLKQLKHRALLALLFPLLGIVIGLSIYTPAMLFLPLLLAVLKFSHPKLRLLFKQFGLRLSLPSLIGFLLVISPLLLQIVMHRGLIWQIIGLRSDFQHFFQPLVNAVDFWSVQKGFFLQPVFSLGALAIGLIGIYSLLSQFFSIRSMTILYLLVISLGACLILNLPAIVVLWLPISFLIAYGIHSMILSWMTIFPLNPYSRIFGTVMIGLVVIMVSLAGADNLFKNYAYNPILANQFRQDLTLLYQQLNTKNTKPLTLIVANQTEYNFYRYIKKANFKLKIFDSQQTDYDQVILTKQAFDQATNLMPTSVLTDGHSQDFDRFYIYQKNQN